MPCSHIMLSQRHRLRDFDVFGSTAKKFLSLRPTCCLSWANSLPDSLESRRRNSNSRLERPKSLHMQQIHLNFAAKMSDSLYGNYHAYLYDARQKIIVCQLGCAKWSSKYNGEEHENENTTARSPNTNSNHSIVDDLPTEDILDSIKSILDEGKPDFSTQESDFTFSSENSDDPIDIDQDLLNRDIETLLNDEIDTIIPGHNGQSMDNDFENVESQKAVDSIFSMGDSSGYESLALKTHEDEFPATKDVVGENLNGQKESLTETNMTECTDTNSRPDVGIFLDTILKKLESMTSNNLYVNLHLTGLISRLAVYRQPLLQSFLLNPSLVFQPSIRSLFQVSQLIVLIDVKTINNKVNLMKLN